MVRQRRPRFSDLLLPRGGAVPERGELPSIAATAGLLRFRRFTFRLAALVIASFYWVDWFQPRFAQVALLRALWIAALLGAAALQRPARPRRATRAAQLASYATTLAVVGIVSLDGGTASIYHGMLLATPFLVLLGVVEKPSVAAINGAICGFGGAAIRIAEGEAALAVSAWLFLSAVVSALATWSTVAARQGWQLELAAERERLAIERQLGESEQQRAEAERLAAVGRLAARVAHEVNNPLSVVKSNVQWLGAAGASAEAAERDEVVADTLESVDRIVEAVDEVRRQAGDRPLPR